MTINQAVCSVLELKDFAPHPNTNKVMTTLVESIVASSDLHEPLPFSSDKVHAVQSICQKTETLLEDDWARRIASSTYADTLETFPYRDNYTELVARELSLAASSGWRVSKNKRALVVGSGPLPLTAIELYRQTGMAVDQVDSSVEANRLSEAVCQSAGIPTNYYDTPGENVVLSGVYDYVLIAALAGSTLEDKQAIIENIMPYMAADGRIVMRSAWGARELLYPAIKADDIRGVRKLAEYHPNDYVINSVYIYGGDA